MTFAAVSTVSHGGCRSHYSPFFHLLKNSYSHNWLVQLCPIFMDRMKKATIESTFSSEFLTCLLNNECCWGGSGRLLQLELTFLVAQLRRQRVRGGRSVLVLVQREQRGKGAFAGDGLLGPPTSTGAPTLAFWAGVRPPALPLQLLCLKKRTLNMHVASFSNKSNMSSIKDVICYRSITKPRRFQEGGNSCCDSMLVCLQGEGSQTTPA